MVTAYNVGNVTDLLLMLMALVASAIVVYNVAACFVIAAAGIAITVMSPPL